MMAEERDSAHGSFCEGSERRRIQVHSSDSSLHIRDETVPVSSSENTVNMNPGISGASCLSNNPFAIKVTTPTRGLADSTDDKESRPLVAPPILKLGQNRTSPLSKIVLRPSVLTAQAELLKLTKMQDSGMMQDSQGNKLDESNKVTVKEAHSTINENTNELSRNDMFVHGISASKNITSSADLNLKFSKSTDNSGNVGFVAGDSNEAVADGGSFVFGQNLHERVLNYEEPARETTSLIDSCNLTFEEAVLKKELEIKEGEEQESKLPKSLSESAKEYESRQVKRKFDEVTVVTGEEEESNVMQINCKLFTFNKSSSSWQERGRGILRLNDKEVEGILHSRVVMRTQGSLHVVMNAKVWPGMSVEHPSPKTVRLTAVDTQGVKVYLVMANPKDAIQLFNALDWRITALKSSDNHLNDIHFDEKQSITEAACSSELPDSSGHEINFEPARKRHAFELSGGACADSSTEIQYRPRFTSDSSSDISPNQDNASSFVSD